MNVALIVLPNNEPLAAPPLTLAYIAAVLEHQRHIVRIYDLALTPDVPLVVALRPLQTFRPQVVMVVGEQLSLLEDAVEVLDAQHNYVVPMQLRRGELAIGRACAEVLAWINQQPGSLAENEKNVTGGTPAPDAFVQDLDQLPFPARHLLSLEQYGLRAVGNELQTTLLIGLPHSEQPDKVVLRAPAQIVSELRSVSREYGIRHYLFPGVALTTDMEWLHEFLTRLRDADLRIAWEGVVNTEKLDMALLKQMVQAGCEVLRFDFYSTRVFESFQIRSQLKQTVANARQVGIYARADLELEPPYESLPHLIDVASTFGFDSVNFKVRSATSQDTMQEEFRAIGEDMQLEEYVRQRYYAGRTRQQLIDRFGSALGTLLWRLRSSRIGLALAHERGAGGLDDQEDLPESA